MSRGRGRPTNGSILKAFRIDPEIEILVNHKLAALNGTEHPPHGAFTKLVNALLREWLSKEKSNVGTDAAEG